MNYCRGSYSIIFLLLITLHSVFFPRQIFGFESVSLSVPQFSQHLTVADANGDTGYYNCAIAASAMAIQAMYGEAPVFSQSEVSYSSIRKKSRAVFLDVQKGITLREAASIIPLLTNNNFAAEFIKFDQTHWQEEMSYYLSEGYPLIAHISDWSSLWNHEGKTKSAHAILITGISETSVQYVDPWDGYRYAVPHELFGAAWSQGYYNWHAMVFIPTGGISLAANLMQ